MIFSGSLDDRTVDSLILVLKILLFNVWMIRYRNLIKFKLFCFNIMLQVGEYVVPWFYDVFLFFFFEVLGLINLFYYRRLKVSLPQHNYADTALKGSASHKVSLF